MLASRAAEEVRAALSVAEDQAKSPVERAEMLMEIALGLQQRPKAPDELHAAVELYERARSVCPDNQKLLRARITARQGTALQAIPEPGTDSLERARAAFEAAIPVLRNLGLPEELSEAEMNLGVTIQALAGSNRARVGDAISAYQRALRTFNGAEHPKEFAILQNNLATAFLSMAFTDERSKMREALAVQAFEEGLKVVNLIDHPSEYAMLQNNLGNALQYASSSHVVENNLRALEAYNEALKVRNAETTPLEYANTISNKANCLWNLPDDPTDPDTGNRAHLMEARSLYAESRELFMAHGEPDKARIVGEALTQVDREILATAEPSKGAAETTVTNGKAVN